MTRTVLVIYKVAENPGEPPRLPLGGEIAAGWPSPAEDYIQGELNLHEHFVKNSASTYLVKVMGDSMIGARICDGDMVVVDCSKTPQSGDVVVAVVDGEQLIKRFIIDKTSGRQLLVPENPPLRQSTLMNGKMSTSGELLQVAIIIYKPRPSGRATSHCINDGVPVPLVKPPLWALVDCNSLSR